MTLTVNKARSILNRTHITWNDYFDLKRIQASNDNPVVKQACNRLCEYIMRGN